MEQVLPDTTRLPAAQTEQPQHDPAADHRDARITAMLSTPEFRRDHPLPADAPADLAEACDWAVEVMTVLDRDSKAADWTDADTDRELDRHGAVFVRAISEPSPDLRTIAAKGRLALEDFERFRVDTKDKIDDTDRMVLTVLREVSGIIEAASEATDPIFALIEAHRAAYAEWDRTSAVWNEMPLDDPGFGAARAASDGPRDRETSAMEALITALPTTLAGVQALAEYLPGAIRRVNTHTEASDGERALQAIASALRLILARPSSRGSIGTTPCIDIFSRINLNSATMDELLALHGTASLIGDVAHAASWQGRSHKAGPGSEENPAGEFMTWLGDELIELASTIEGEARRRVPTKPDDRETRLELMALAIVENGDPAEIAAFAHELTVHAVALSQGA